MDIEKSIELVNDITYDSFTSSSRQENEENEGNYLQISEENISFTPTEQVQITVRNLSIGSSFSNNTKKRIKSSLSNLFKIHDKSQIVDIEANDSIKTILHSMSFDIPPNSLTCIVGGSGSGKTTLLNFLANRKFSKKTMIQQGIVKYNDSDDLTIYRNAYVIQQDILTPTLTCFETLMYSAELKLPKLTSKEDRANLVDEIILTLGLKECKDTLVGDNKNKGLSGGERRRLTVGLQLISNPSILFLDEPTTGLDNYNAYLLCKSFQHLAKRLNKTIIMSIHQPRADIFKLFDTVLILSKGRLCYGGSYENIFTHFSSLGFNIPETKVNPADYFVDVTSIDTRTRAKEIESTRRVELIVNSWKDKMQSFKNVNELDLCIKNDLNESEMFQEVGSAPFLREVNILIRRNFKLQYRDPIGWFSIIFESLFLGLLCGWLFYRPGMSLAGIRSLQAALYMSCSMQCYLLLLYEIYRLCQNDLKVFDRERMENCVSVTGFLLARRISKFFTEDVFITICFSVTTYFMYGLRTDSARYFWMYFIGVFIFHINTMSFATFAAACSRDVSIATLIGNLNFTFQSMTNGLFANARQLPVYVRWCKYVAYLWYSFGYLASNQFTNFDGGCYEIHKNDPNVNQICYQFTGKYILLNLGFWENWYALPIFVVLAFSIGTYILAGIVFYIKPLDMAMGKEIKVSNSIDNSIDYSQKLETITNQKMGTSSTGSNHENFNPFSNYIEVNIENVNLSVHNKLKKSSKNILENINAKFLPGKLNVIMGPSGSGKTSLLNLISGRLSSNLLTEYSSSGNIYLNNCHITDYTMIRPICSYVVQEDDHLLSAITVRETLVYAARLRLSKTKLSLKEQEYIVDDIILKMGLKDCANTLVGNELIKGISGGEKRRLSIAIQLISSPKILFLDEPTSGLDSFTAASIVECLEKLTKQGTTIIMTIHQPRSLEHFGSILLLAKGGKVAFNGTEDLLITHFTSLGYPVPKLTNLADFIIDLISYNTSNSVLEKTTKSRVNHIIESWKDKELEYQIDDVVLLTNKSEVRDKFKSIIKERASFITGFRVLASRQWIGLVRDKKILIARCTQITGMAVILALFFSRLKYNTTSIQNRLGLIQQMTALYFSGMLNNLSSYPQERDYFYDEYDDDVVGLNSFFFSYLLIEIPFEVFSCLIFAIFMVFVIGFQINAGLFFTIFYGTVLMVNAGESLGISLNTVFDHPGFALNIISVFCSIGVGMAGLLAMTLDNFLKAMNYISPLHYCVMLTSNQVFTSSLKFTCTHEEASANGTCLFNNGEDVIKAYNLDINLTLYFVLFSVITVLQRVVSWMFLKIKLMKIRIKKPKKH
jgi:ABC-type multidrug transport system ATPase subunit